MTTRIMPPVACTIVSNNYLPFARTFARSFLEHHREGTVWVCLVDRPAAEIDYGREPFRVLVAEDLGIPAFQNLAFRYSILELNTAVKPYLLARLHEEHGYDAVCYFDPDILVLDDLLPIYQLLRKADVVLTPHILEPIDDSLIPSERDFLLSGIYNLGFLGIAFNEQTGRFLDWWQARLYRYCEHRVERGLFVDQRWMDFAPAFLRHPHILRDPGCNVAYWNLMHRRLESDGRGYHVEGNPLRFFHFSGFRPEQPDLVSKYQDRIHFESRPDIQPLFEDYAARLYREGLDELADMQYAYGHFTNGATIPKIAREVLRLVDPKGVRWEDPFSTSNDDSFFAWLCDPTPVRGRVTHPRIALALWDLRPDLQKAFPQPLGLDAARYANWFGDEVKRADDFDTIFARGLALVPMENSDVSPLPPQVRASLPPSLLEMDGRRIHVSEEDARLLNAEASYDPAARPRVTRLAMMLHRDRSDLVTSYPEPLGRNRRNFVLWFVTSGRIEYSLPYKLVAPALRTLPLRDRFYAGAWWLRHGPLKRLLRRSLPRQRPFFSEEVEPVPLSKQQLRPTSPDFSETGINVVGWVTARTGVGEACRGTVAALERNGIPNAVWGLKHPALESNGEIFGREDPELPYSVTLFHVNADMMALVAAGIPLSCCQPHYRIGYWFWELSHFPVHFSTCFQHVDEVWAPTRFCQRAYEVLSPVPVRWMPPAVRPVRTRYGDRKALGLPEGAFVFFFAFDAMSIPERKNPFALLQAFEKLLARVRQPVHLLIKVSHGDEQRELLTNLRRRSKKLPITLLNRSVTRQELEAMMAACDAYVSLHRSEGLGLPLIEAMMHGKPVIATNYGGCTDFLDETTGWPVDYQLIALDRSYGPYPQGTVWADALTEQAASQMYDVIHQTKETARRISAAHRRIEELYSLDSAGRRLREELDRITAGQRRRAVVADVDRGRRPA